MNLKLLIPTLLVSLLYTGCLDTPGNPNGEPVDETGFLEENAKKEGVTVTDTGLQYRVLAESEGETPFDGAVVFVEYEGRLINGDVFVRTDQLDYFPLTNQILPGIHEGIQLIETGAEYELVLPTELGYGDNPPPGTPIRPGSVLIFDMKLDSFLQDPNQFLNENAQREEITVTDSGLQYRVIQEGDSNSPSDSSSVLVNYEGTFTNGYVFDKSGDTPASFQVQSVIPGFSEGLQLMGTGAIYEFFIPADIGYGADTPQSIPEGAVLVFEVELLEFTD